MITKRSDSHISQTRKPKGFTLGILVQRAASLALVTTAISVPMANEANADIDFNKKPVSKIEAIGEMSSQNAETSLMSRDEVSKRVKDVKVEAPSVPREVVMQLIGDNAGLITSARMISPDTCVLLSPIPDYSGMEVILLNVHDGSVLSCTIIPHADFLRNQGWEGDVYYLLLGSDLPIESTYQYYQIKVSIAADMSVNTEQMVSNIMTMPGGKVAIRDDWDGCLYGVDLASGEEGLLLQGVPNEMTNLVGESSYASYLKYTPCEDDIGYDIRDEEGNMLAHPLSEEQYNNSDIGLWRYFGGYEALDADRFIYVVSGWEWGAGFGIYDLKTHTDHRITGTGSLYGRRGSYLFGSFLQVDIHGLETQVLPQNIQDQFEQVSAMEDGRISYDISQDGGYLALGGLKSRQSGAKDVQITSMRTGEVIRSIDIADPNVLVEDVSFYGENKIMLLVKQSEKGQVSLYLLDFGLD